MDIHPNRASRLAPVASAVVTGLTTGSLVAVWRGAADGPAWSMSLAAGLLALTAVLALAWLSRTRAARRLRAAVDDFAEREIARERRRNAAEPGRTRVERDDGRTPPIAYAEEYPPPAGTCSPARRGFVAPRHVTLEGTSTLFTRREQMHKRSPGLVLAAILVAVLAAPAPAADGFTIDPVHSGVSFRIQHVGLSSVHGRFNDFSGKFAIDPDPAKCAFEMTIKVDSVDTNNKQRDTHLRGPDFFNAKQFASITFKSTSVKAIDGGYEVKGDLTIHGVTKPVTLSLKGGKTAEFPRGVKRTGYSGEVTIKRSEFEVGKPDFAAALGDEVHVSIDFEGMRK